METKQKLSLIAIVLFAVIVAIGGIIYTKSNKPNPQPEPTNNNSENETEVTSIKEYKLENAGNAEYPADETKLPDLPEQKDLVVIDDMQKTFKAVNGDTYEIKEEGAVEMQTALLKNNKEVWKEQLTFTTYHPIKSRFITKDTFVLSYDKYIGDLEKDPKLSRNIIYNDGIDVNKKYGYDQSFAPSPLGKDTGKFYFFAIKEGKFLLVSDQKEFPLNYDEVTDPPCCSPAAFAVRNGYEEVRFFAKRDNQWYLVIADLKSIFGD